MLFLNFLLLNKCLKERKSLPRIVKHCVFLKISNKQVVLNKSMAIFTVQVFYKTKINCSLFECLKNKYIYNII